MSIRRPFKSPFELTKPIRQMRERTRFNFFRDRDLERCSRYNRTRALKSRGPMSRKHSNRHKFNTPTRRQYVYVPPFRERTKTGFFANSTTRGLGLYLDAPCWSWTHLQPTPSGCSQVTRASLNTVQSQKLGEERAMPRPEENLSPMDLGVPRSEPNVALRTAPRLLRPTDLLHKQ